MALHRALHGSSVSVRCSDISTAQRLQRPSTSKALTILVPDKRGSQDTPVLLAASRRTRASKCKPESQNEALVPSTHRRRKDLGPDYRAAVLETYLHFSIALICPTQETNLALQPIHTYQDPGARNPSTRKRKACLDSPEQIHKASLPGNG